LPASHSENLPGEFYGGPSVNVAPCASAPPLVSFLRWSALVGR
jgi:hypothetical protein